MNLSITTPFGYLELDVHKWFFSSFISLERDNWWIVNFSIGYRYLIVWARRVGR